MAAPKGNKFANKYSLGLTNNGRPPKYNNPEELAEKIQSYFQYCQDNSEKVTITGLALYLGFCERKSLDDYAERSEQFLYIIKRAKMAVENGYESRGQVMDIFALKNMGWIDTQRFDHTNNGNSFTTLSDAELIARVAKLIEAGKQK